MKLFESLNNELSEVTEGVFAPYYFRFIGYKKDLCAPAATLRANGVYSLFSEPTPVILKSELIAGNGRLLYSTADGVQLKYAECMVNNFGRRTFATNYDHFAPDYAHFLTVGIPGILAQIDRSLENYKDDAQKQEYLCAMRRTIEGFCELIKNYISVAKSQKGKQGYSDRRLDFIISNCEAILVDAPKTFAQALQLVFLCYCAFVMEERFAMAFGRMDQYLYPFYKKDVESGTITDDEVVELLENVFIRLQKDITNICVGGMDSKGNCQVNELSFLIVSAVKNCNVPGPNLSARITPNTPDEFLDECLKSIGTGLGYPALMNDEVNIAALKKYHYDIEDIYDYSMVGCIENFITGKQPPWTDERYDTPRYFDYVFNNGVSKTNNSVGLDLGDVSKIKSMDEFVECFKTELAYGVEEYCSKINARGESINQAFFPDPFISCFCYDCIGRGLDINNGGSKYPSVHGAGVMGIATVCDSLAAIEKVVFIDKAATLDQLKNAINDNFEGHEDLRERLLEAPKYGNNDAFVDKYATEFVQYINSLFCKHKTFDGGDYYIGMASNVSNIYAGRTINATPDGRKRGEPLSDAASPTYGKDTRGATATINSISKPDYTDVALGSVINQKFSPSMFDDGKRQKLAALVRTYFKNGGQEIQINATSAKVLKDAMDNPEKYQSLVVRVSGFSAYYVTLERAIQLDILSRTQKDC